MTVLMELEFPIQRQDIEELTRRMGVTENPPDGLLVHLAVESGTGLRVVDVWDSAADFERFQETRIGPALEAMMADRGMASLPADIQPKITEAFDVVRGKGLG
jgi:hypothetical protein